MERATDVLAFCQLRLANTPCNQASQVLFVPHEIQQGNELLDERSCSHIWRIVDRTRSYLT